MTIHAHTRFCDIHGPFPGAICGACAEGFALSLPRTPSPYPAMLLELADMLVRQAILLAEIAQVMHEEAR